MGTWVMSQTKSGIRVRYKNQRTDMDKLGEVNPSTSPATIADWIFVNAQAGDVILLSDGSQLQKLPTAEA